MPYENVKLLNIPFDQWMLSNNQRVETGVFHTMALNLVSFLQDLLTTSQVSKILLPCFMG